MKNVIVLMIILFGVVVPTSINAQSTTNLVSNGGFENASTSTIPDFWKKGRWGNNTAVFSYPVTGSDGGKAANVTLSNRVSGDAKWYHVPLNLPTGRYTYSDQYISNVSTYITVEIRHSNGSVTYSDIAQPPASTDWRSISANFEVPSTATAVTVFHLINKNGSLTLDNVSISSTAGAGVFSTGAVTIRLDDNWLSQYQNAFPILDAHNIKATLYVASRQIRDLGFVGYMSRAEIEEVFNRGHEIGAHTRRHKDLVILTPAERINEINGSREDIIAWDAGPVLTFSYPFGSYNSDVVQAVKDAGFQSAASSNGGIVRVSSNPYILERRALESATTFDQVKVWIDQAKAEKNWLILTIHEVRPSCSTRYCTTTAILGQVADYIDSIGIRTVTISEGMESF